MPAWSYLSAGACEHRRPPASCVDCAAQAERARVLMLLDDIECDEASGLLAAIRVAVASGAFAIREED